MTKPVKLNQPDQARPFDIRLNVNFEDIRVEIEQQFNKEIRQRITREANELFYPAGTFKGARAGIGWELIMARISEILLSDEIAKKIDETILRYMDTALDKVVEEATSRAIKKLIYIRMDELTKI